MGRVRLRSPLADGYFSSVDDRNEAMHASDILRKKRTL